MEYGQGRGSMVSGIFRSMAHSRAEKKRRDFEEKLEEKRISSRMEMAKQNRIHEKELAMSAAENQLKIALFQAEIQWKMAMIDAGEKRELARFNAEVQKELAEFNAKNQMDISVHMAELTYGLENFPLYVRKWSSRNLIQNAEFLPVKVVVIPPKDGDCEWGECFTSCITQFLQRNISKDYYEFLGGAWRGGRCTGQAAYTLIYEEFRDEPFLIIDCGLTKEYYFSVRLCFWHPDSVKYETRQLISNWDLRTIFPILEEHMDEREYIKEHYQEYMVFCATLCELVIGIGIDTYQLSVGVAVYSEILASMPQIVDEFLRPVMKERYPEMLQWMLKEYEMFIEEVPINTGIRIHCICQLASAILVLKRPKAWAEAKRYTDKAWELWCKHMGFDEFELGSILQSQSDMRALCQILQEDASAMEEMEDIYNLGDKLHSVNGELIQLKREISTGRERAI